MKVLIVGYGRAGTRHATMLRKILSSIEIVAVDPFVTHEDVLFFDLKDALDNNRRYDFSVICTPPDQHINDIRVCLDRGIKVIMCEKPICGLGQIKEAEDLGDVPVMVAYNYRFHQEVARALKRTQQPGKKWQCFSDQQRTVWPNWEFVVDHTGHTFDLLHILADSMTVDSAVQLTHRTDDGYKAGTTLWIQGKTADGTKVEIADCVRKYPVERRAWINGPCGYLDMTKNAGMFERLWASFFSALSKREKFAINVKEALVAQRLIEDTNRILIRRDVPWSTPATF